MLTECAYTDESVTEEAIPTDAVTYGYDTGAWGDLLRAYDGEEIIATPEHPFYSPVKGWTDAIHLRTGDILVLVNGEYIVV